MVLRSVLLASVSVVTITGCAAQKQAAPAADARPAFMKPSDIRPADSTFQPAPMPAAAAPKAAPATEKQVAGPWAPPVKSRTWKYIVLHHSASPTGNAAMFDREHREKGWDELGYHFVIDNGRGGSDGAIEIGPRWLKQKWGAHAKTPDNRFNDFGIGICFVGNFEQGKPTAKQLAAASKLVAWLMKTYDIPQKNILGHEDTGKSTLCPGKFLSVAKVRSLADLAFAQSDFLPTPLLEDEDAIANANLALSPETLELLQDQ